MKKNIILWNPKWISDIKKKIKKICNKKITNPLNIDDIPYQTPENRKDIENLLHLTNKNNKVYIVKSIQRDDEVYLLKQGLVEYLLIEARSIEPKNPVIAEVLKVIAKSIDNAVINKPK